MSGERAPIILLCVTAIVVWFLCFGTGRPAFGQERSATGLMRSGCPDLIEIIKDLTPAVVSISVEKHMLQRSASRPPPLFRSRPGRHDPRIRRPDGFQLDSIGSGFFYDTKGRIITNAHVVEGASKIRVRLSSGSGCSAKVVAVHPKVDLALLKIDPPHELKKAEIGDSSRVQVGEWVLAVGNPFGLGRTVTFGIVSGKGRFIGLDNHDDFIQTDASINPGNSGGPLFNMAGQVVGVNTAIIASGKGIGFSIPVNYVHELVRSGERMDGPFRGWLGVYVEDMTAEQARRLGYANPRGTFVDEVLKGTPAAGAGLEKGDLILSADEEDVRDGRHLSRIVAGAEPGDLIRMTVRRGDKTERIDVIVGKSPE